MNRKTCRDRQKLIVSLLSKSTLEEKRRIRAIRREGPQLRKKVETL